MGDDILVIAYQNTEQISAVLGAESLHSMISLGAGSLNSMISLGAGSLDSMILLGGGVIE